MESPVAARSGKVVATERVSDSRKAEQIADYWRGSGMEVEVIDPAAIETDPPERPNR